MANYSGLKELPLHQLVSRIVILEAPSAITTATFAPVVLDALNQGIALTPDIPTYPFTFMD